ncbi:MAG: HEPN domain-containing protein [Blautia sp.]|nr:HEPN domain-containing protein [Blautia sp.]
MERSLELNPSKENIRDSHQPPIVKFHLDQIKQHFDSNIIEIEAQFDVADSLISENRREDAENIWRYQIVFLESAFDFYLHEVTKYGLASIFEGQWDKTPKYQNIKIDMELIEQVLHGNADSEWFAAFVNDAYAKTTMVSFDSVKDQMNLIGLELQKIADCAFYDVNSDEKTMDKLKRVVDSLYYRRNAIAHQSDREHATAEKNTITKETIEEFIMNITKIVEAIHREMEAKNSC